MTIETKHSINDKVWVMYKNKPQYVTINSSTLAINENKQLSEKYTVKEITLDSNKNYHPYFEKLFSTKEELIASL
jgi:hypothetical protein